VEIPDGRADTNARRNCASPLHRLGQCRALSTPLHRSTRRPDGLLLPRGGDLCRTGQQLVIINVGGGPADDNPTVTLETPRDPDRVSSFLNIRVKDVHALYTQWSARGAQFLTPPKQRQYEIRCYLRDPDGHLIEVGQTTDLEGDWSPAHWPPSTRAGDSE